MLIKHKIFEIIAIASYDSNSFLHNYNTANDVLLSITNKNLVKCVSYSRPVLSFQ